MPDTYSALIEKIMETVPSTVHVGLMFVANSLALLS